MMSIISNFIRRYKDRFSLLLRKFGWWIPDRPYLLMMYYIQMGEMLHLRNPKTFSEKLQWLKLYNRKPEYTMMVDKYAVKEYVTNIIGKEYIIPTLGVWEKPEDIEWEKLPNQFVLKTTHGGGSKGVVICKDKSKFEISKTIKQLNRAMKQDVYRNYREWPYKHVKHRIIAEQFMEEKVVDNRPIETDLVDYKFYCFHGEPKYCQVIRDRSTKETIDFYDMEWTHMPFCGLNPVAKNGLNPVAKPIHLDRMKEIACKLSQDIPFTRVDFYIINDIEYFGEITFYPASGFGLFTPKEWNMQLGNLISFPLC